MFMQDSGHENLCCKAQQPFTCHHTISVGIGGRPRRKKAVLLPADISLEDSTGLYLWPPIFLQPGLCTRLLLEKAPAFRMRAYYRFESAPEIQTVHFDPIAEDNAVLRHQRSDAQ